MLKFLSVLFLGLLALFSKGAEKQVPHLASKQANILLILADDWSYPHASIYGDKVVKTPNFDRIAKEGVLFDQAFVSSPSCTPSRAAMLTGQDFWRLGEGANLYGTLDLKHPIYPEILEKAGYKVGHTLKGWGPGSSKNRGRNPAGPYFKSFDEFLDQKDADSPFCFWFGSYLPHRGYKKGSGIEAGIDPSKIEVPACMPDSKTVRSDIADYYKEVQDFDEQIGLLLKKLEAIGELDNTLIVVTSDNGMPFPRAKSNVYDLGTRVPLAFRWGNNLARGFKAYMQVNLTDLAPTFLEAANLEVPEEMSGTSLMPYLKSDYKKYKKYVYFGKERHVPGQEQGDWSGYPSRAIRSEEFLYIKNFKPDNWPAGTPNYQLASFYPSYYSDVDGGPTRTYMIANKDKDNKHQQLFQLAFGKRPAEELYYLNDDPEQLDNLAQNPKYAKMKKLLAKRLKQELKRTKDPRATKDFQVFEQDNYIGGAPWPDDFKRENLSYASHKIEKFSSKYIPDRSIEVLVPSNSKYGEKFPVLYMFDGQNLFHEFKGWGGEPNKGWRVDQVLDSLYKAKALDRIIVVGVFSEANRMSEYMPQKPETLLKERIASSKDPWYKSFKESPPNSDQTLKFIVEELKPYIDKNYPSLKDRANTYLAGSSMGGLISAYAICEYPEVFGGAACISTHWPPLDGVVLEYFKNNLPDPKTHKIYFDFGTEGLDASYEPYQKIMDQAMEKNGFLRNENWITKKFEGATHYEDDWFARLHIPLQFLISKN